MTLLRWKPSFSLGIPSVDLEHRELIAMVNEVYARLEARCGEGEPLAIEAALGEIHAGIAAHFALEEVIMRQTAYAGYAAHKDNHEALLDQIRDLMDVYCADPQQGRARLERELSNWFGQHFSTFDAWLHSVCP